MLNELKPSNKMNSIIKIYIEETFKEDVDYIIPWGYNFKEGPKDA